MCRAAIKKKHMDKITFSKRFQEELRNHDLTIDDLEPHIDKSRSTLYRWADPEESGYPKGRSREAFIEACKVLGLDYEYMFSNESKQISRTVSRGVPFYDIDIRATSIQMMENIQELEPAFFITIPKFAHADFSYRMRGHSMKGRYNQGVVVVCKRVVDVHSYWNKGEAYFIVTRVNNMRTVKYVKAHEDPELLWLIPHNVEQFDPDVIRKDDILFLYEVLGEINDID